MMTNTIRQQAASVQAWNATGPIHSRVELDNPSFVKCLVSRSGRILAFSRMPMADGDDPTTGGSIRKVLGIIAFERETLCQVSALTAAPFEAQASIEQSRLLENDFALQSVSWGAAFPSVNEPADVAEVEHVLNHDAMQRALLARVVALHGTEESR
jgi:CMP-2-keto-3-deoxyoctulosonic acid synthetase